MNWCKNQLQRKNVLYCLEGDEPRTVQAAAICQSRGIAHCILLAKPEAVVDVAKARGIRASTRLRNH